MYIHLSPNIPCVYLVAYIRIYRDPSTCFDLIDQARCFSTDLPRQSVPYFTAITTSKQMKLDKNLQIFI